MSSVTSFDKMVREAARWQGAAIKVAQTLDGDHKAQLRHMRMTTKGDLDSYLTRRFGIDATTAREVSNELTRSNIPADMSARIEDFPYEPWIANAGCRHCRHWQGNGGLDCNPDEEDFTSACEGFEVFQPDESGNCGWTATCVACGNTEAFGGCHKGGHEVYTCDCGYEMKWSEYGSVIVSEDHTVNMAHLDAARLDSRIGFFIQRCDVLLQKCFGITVGDTSLSDEDRVRAMLEAGVIPRDAVNEEAEENELARIDVQGAYGAPVCRPISKEEELQILNDNSKSKVW